MPQPLTEQFPRGQELYGEPVPETQHAELIQSPATTAEHPVVWQSIGEPLLQAVARQQEREPRTRRAGGFMGRLLARLETATQRQQERLADELEAGDNALLRQQHAHDQRMYDWTTSRYERFSGAAASFQERARSCHAKGGIFGTIRGWFNGFVAGYYRWRAGMAKNRRDYHAQGLA